MDYRKYKTPVMFLAVIFLGLCLQLPIQTLQSLPVHQRISVGERINFDLGLPKILANNFQFNITGAKPSSFCMGDTTPVAATPGDLKIKVKLFGLIPVRDMTVSVVPEIRVVPGGQAIGVMVESEGVMVVGRSAIVDEKGARHNPAAEAGIELGDILMKVCGQKVETEQQARDLINNLGQNGQTLEMEFKDKHSRLTFKRSIKPIFCKDTHRYRVGLFVRDTTAGVGTMTFYHPETRSYGALGHIISDIDTCQPINLNSGKIVGAQIEGIRIGRKGQPGEKLGIFKGMEDISGNITKNTNCGIFGKLEKEPSNSYTKQTIPVALAHEVKEGPAEIYTVLRGSQIEKFNIEIQEINPRGKQEGKGMIIKITDPELLKKTGGIIQGMSGSPIIQEGKLVGAVTHVFVNDPTRGYGVLAEWMLYDAGTIITKVSERNQDQFDVKRNVAC